MTTPPEQETKMAETTTMTPAPIAPAPIAPAPVTEEAFLADRQKFFSEFTGFTFFAAVSIAVLLILLAIFLV